MTSLPSCWRLAGGDSGVVVRDGHISTTNWRWSLGGRCQHCQDRLTVNIVLITVLNLQRQNYPVINLYFSFIFFCILCSHFLEFQLGFISNLLNTSSLCVYFLLIDRLTDYYTSCISTLTCLFIGTLFSSYCAVVRWMLWRIHWVLLEHLWAAQYQLLCICVIRVQTRPAHCLAKEHQVKISQQRKGHLSAIGLFNDQYVVGFVMFYIRHIFLLGYY